MASRFPSVGDQREAGPLSGCVDQEGMAANSIIRDPAQPAALRRVCLANRASHPTQSGQDAAYKSVTEARASLFGSKVTGLVAHRDKTAPHGHGHLPAFRPDGRPLLKVLTPGMAKQVQEVAAKAIAEFAPQIVRGKPKALADGARAIQAQKAEQATRETAPKEREKAV